MQKKTIRVSSGMPMYIKGCVVPWDDISFRFNIGRKKKISWYPCIIGLTSLRSDIRISKSLLSKDKIGDQWRKDIEEELTLYNTILNSGRPYWMKGNREDGAWDNIYYPSEYLDKIDIERAFAFGLEQRYGITTPLRFRWDKVYNYIIPA